MEWTCENGMRIPTCQEQVKTVGFTAKRGVVIEYIDKPLSVVMAVFCDLRRVFQHQVSVLQFG